MSHWWRPRVQRDDVPPGARGAAEAAAPPARPVLTNTAASPRLGRAQLVERRDRATSAAQFDSGAVYVHAHTTAHKSGDGLRLTATDDVTDSYVAPGGRDDAGTVHLGLRAGGTFTVSAVVSLSTRASGRQDPHARSIVVGATVDKETLWHLASSGRAPNESGTWQVATTVTIPDEATSAWVRLMHGGARGSADITFDKLLVVETRADVPYFDGDTAADDWYEYAWTGEQHRSSSTRTMRDPAASFDMSPQRAVTLDPESRRKWAERVLDVLAVRAQRGLGAEARALLRYLQHGSRTGDPYLAAGRTLVHRFEGNPVKAWHWADRAVTLAPRWAVGHDIRAALSAAASQWPDAARASELAVRQAPTTTRKLQRASHLERVGRGNEAASIVRALCDDDEHGLVLPRAAFEQMPQSALVRVRVATFVRERLAEVQSRAASFLAETEDQRSNQRATPVFTYWGQGIEQAPAVVKRCRSELLASTPHVTTLDDSNLAYYAELPDVVVARIGDRRAQFSDAVRIDLLARYGGIWADATCLVRGDLRAAVAAVAGGRFFAFRYSDARISSWLLSAPPGCRVASLTRAAYMLWWEEQGDLADYFLFHHLFEALYWHDEDFRAEIDGGARLDARVPHRVQLAMFDDFEPEAHAELVASTFVHKLRYQYYPRSFTSSSLLAKIVRDGASWAGPSPLGPRPVEP